MVTSGERIVLRLSSRFEAPTEKQESVKTYVLWETGRRSRE